MEALTRDVLGPCCTHFDVLLLEVFKGIFFAVAHFKVMYILIISGCVRIYVIFCNGCKVTKAFRLIKFFHCTMSLCYSI